jgi:MYXO-CTERM domain-containing protein
MSMSNRLANHFALAAVATAAVAATSNAAVVYSGIINFACNADTDGAYINVETGLMSNGPASGVPGWDVNPYMSLGGMNFYHTVPAGNAEMRRAGVTTGTAGNLAVGTVVGAAGSFNTSNSGVYGTTSATGLLGGWTYSAENIIGFKFLGADALTHYGWMRFAMGAATGSTTVGPTRTIIDYAYESTAGASITVTPAPGAIALLGLAGLVTRRRRA